VPLPRNYCKDDWEVSSTGTDWKISSKGRRTCDARWLIAVAIPYDRAKRGLMHRRLSFGQSENRKQRKLRCESIFDDGI